MPAISWPTLLPAGDATAAAGALLRTSTERARSDASHPFRAAVDTVARTHGPQRGEVPPAPPKRA
jgi:hypothetical protein